MGQCGQGEMAKEKLIRLTREIYGCVRYCKVSASGRLKRVNTDNFHFVTQWRLKARADEVYDVIAEPLEYPRWWPSVYLNVRETAAGKPGGLGRRVRLHTKGWLPYTLDWEAEVTEASAPGRIVLTASGDLNGTGIWTFVQDSDYVNATFDWTVTPAKSLLRYLTPVMRPVLEANHRWAMEQGEVSLREELIRYRARTPEDLMEAADPRGPVEVPVRWIAVGAVTVSALACIAFARRKSRRAGTASA